MPTVALTEPQPSQLYLNGRKLALATQWFDFDDPVACYDPVPVFEHDESIVLADGHTRAFLAYLAGAPELTIEWCSDDLPRSTYERCVDWCRDDGVRAIPDLAGRVVNAETFEREWVERCRRVE